MNAEFGQPHWVFGTSLYAFASERTIVCSYTKDGCDYLATLDTQAGTLHRVDIPFMSISQVRCSANRVLLSAFLTESTAVVSLDVTTKHFEVLRRSRETSVAIEFLSEAKSIEFPTEGGLRIRILLSAAKP
jgi:hypothetical protein